MPHCRHVDVKVAKIAEKFVGRLCHDLAPAVNVPARLAKGGTPWQAAAALITCNAGRGCGLSEPKAKLGQGHRPGSRDSCCNRAQVRPYKRRLRLLPPERV